MGKNSNANKRVYKRSSQKVYVKGHSKKEAFLEMLARIIAMIFYPFYLLFSGISKGIKKLIAQVKNMSHKETVEKQEPHYTKKRPKQGHKASKSYSNSKSNSKSKKQTSQDQLEGVFDKLGVAVASLKDKIKALPQSVKSHQGKETTGQNAFLAFAQKNKVILSGASALVIVFIVGSIILLGSDSMKDSGNIAAADVHPINIETNAASKAPALTEKPQLDAQINFACLPAYKLVANQSVLGYFKTEDEAQTVLDDLVATYINSEKEEGAEVLKWYFSEDVKIEPTYVDVTRFDGYSNCDEALAYIVKGTKEERTHKVEKGENYWVIAKYYGINPSDLEAANPDVKPETLQIGQVISLVVPKPLIDVCTVEKAQYNDAIPYEVAYEDTSSLYKDETKTKVSGKNGERAVVAEVFKENGREISRNVLQETVISEPVTKVVYKGTKDPPPKMGSGVLKKPTSRGSVTSEYGYRWGRLHAGIDIGVPVGTEVRAADGGVVTYAGYSSSYGYYVMIDHGGNITTVYAHNSKLVVSKGDKVYQGQLISYSGNTGRSTGPHVHFEVRVNGTPVNPRKYVNF